MITSIEHAYLVWFGRWVAIHVTSLLFVTSFFDIFWGMLGVVGMECSFLGNVVMACALIYVILLLNSFSCWASNLASFVCSLALSSIGFYQRFFFGFRYWDLAILSLLRKKGDLAHRLVSYCVFALMYAMVSLISYSMGLQCCLVSLFLLEDCHPCFGFFSSPFQLWFHGPWQLQFYSATLPRSQVMDDIISTLLLTQMLIWFFNRLQPFRFEQDGLCLFGFLFWNAVYLCFLFFIYPGYRLPWCSLCLCLARTYSFQVLDGIVFLILFITG